MGRFDDFKNKFQQSMAEGEAMDKKLQEDRDKMAFKYATGNKITPMSLMDQFTGAPMRAGVSELQKGLGADNFKSAYEKAIEAMSRDPELAPSGLDIAKGTGVDPETKIGKALGVGYDLALDPTNLIPSKGSMAAVGAMGKIADISKMEKGAQALKDVERVKGVLGSNKAREMSKIGGVEKNVKSAAELLDESNKMGKSEFGRALTLGELKKGTPGAELIPSTINMQSATKSLDPASAEVVDEAMRKMSNKEALVPKKEFHPDIEALRSKFAGKYESPEALEQALEAAQKRRFGNLGL